MRKSIKITKGDFTYIAKSIETISWGNNAEIRIGKFCSIAGGVKAIIGGNHNSHWISTYPFGHLHRDLFKKYNGEGTLKPSRDIVIGNDVWIGSGVTIIGGVEIGDGAIVAANSHVTKNIEPYSISGGNPARLIKFRFEKSAIDSLLRIKWWELPIETIDELSPFLCSGNVEKFFEKAKEVGAWKCC